MLCRDSVYFDKLDRLASRIAVSEQHDIVFVTEACVTGNNIYSHIEATAKYSQAVAAQYAGSQPVQSSSGQDCLLAQTLALTCQQLQQQHLTHLQRLLSMMPMCK